MVSGKVEFDLDACAGYVGYQVLGALSTSLLVVLCVDGLGVGRVWAYLASIPPVAVSLFLANRVWTFNVAQDVSPGRGPTRPR